MIGTCCVDVEQTNCINSRTAEVSKVAFLGLRGVAMVTGDLFSRSIVSVVFISPILFIMYKLISNLTLHNWMKSFKT